MTWGYPYFRKPPVIVWRFSKPHGGFSLTRFWAAASQLCGSAALYARGFKYNISAMPIVSLGLLSNQMDVSENSATSKSSILIGFSITNHPFGVPLFLETPRLLRQHVCGYFFDLIGRVAICLNCQPLLFRFLPQATDFFLAVLLCVGRTDWLSYAWSKLRSLCHNHPKTQPGRANRTAAKVVNIKSPGTVLFKVPKDRPP